MSAQRTNQNCADLWDLTAAGLLRRLQDASEDQYRYIDTCLRDNARDTARNAQGANIPHLDEWVSTLKAVATARLESIGIDNLNTVGLGNALRAFRSLVVDSLEAKRQSIVYFARVIHTIPADISGPIIRPVTGVHGVGETFRGGPTNIYLPVQRVVRINSQPSSGPLQATGARRAPPPSGPAPSGAQDPRRRPPPRSDSGAGATGARRPPPPSGPAPSGAQDPRRRPPPRSGDSGAVATGAAPPVPQQPTMPAESPPLPTEGPSVNVAPQPMNLPLQTELIRYPPSLANHPYFVLFLRIMRYYEQIASGQQYELLRMRDVLPDRIGHYDWLDMPVPIINIQMVNWRDVLRLFPELLPAPAPANGTRRRNRRERSLFLENAERPLLLQNRPRPLATNEAPPVEPFNFTNMSPEYPPIFRELNPNVPIIARNLPGRQPMELPANQQANIFGHGNGSSIKSSNSNSNNSASVPLGPRGIYRNPMMVRRTRGRWTRGRVPLTRAQWFTINGFPIGRARPRVAPVPQQARLAQQALENFQFFIIQNGQIIANPNYPPQPRRAFTNKRRSRSGKKRNNTRKVTTPTVRQSITLIAFVLYQLILMLSRIPPIRTSKELVPYASRHMISWRDTMSYTFYFPNPGTCPINETCPALPGLGSSTLVPPDILWLPLPSRENRSRALVLRPSTALVEAGPAPKAEHPPPPPPSVDVAELEWRPNPSRALVLRPSTALVQVRPAPKAEYGPPRLGSVSERRWSEPPPPPPSTALVPVGPVKEGYVVNPRYSKYDGREELIEWRIGEERKQADAAAAADAAAWEQAEAEAAEPPPPPPSTALVPAGPVRNHGKGPPTNLSRLAAERAAAAAVDKLDEILPENMTPLEGIENTVSAEVSANVVNPDKDINPDGALIKLNENSAVYFNWIRIKGLVYGSHTYAIRLEVSPDTTLGELNDIIEKVGEAKMSLFAGLLRGATKSGYTSLTSKTKSVSINGEKYTINDATANIPIGSL